MTFARIIEKLNKTTFAATFGIHLHGIHILPEDHRKNRDEFAMNLLGRQMDFINSLFELPARYAVELRYYFTPEDPYQVHIFFLIQVREPTRKAVAETAADCERYFLRLLQIHNHLHEFAPIETEEKLINLMEPFKIKHLVELVRREDLIPLDSTHKIAAKPVGFHTGPDAPDKTDAPPPPPHPDTPHIYYVFPYSLHLGNMERLCQTLLLQSHPCMINVCMRPYHLTGDDEIHFEERIQLCEKYAQLGLASSEDVEKLRPFLRNQANTLYKNCARDFSQLQDAAFLQRVQIASSHPISHELVTVLGASLTEHTGHPKPPFSYDKENPFIGGYDWFIPRNKPQATTALGNLKKLRFDPWIPTTADPRRAHWRYLLDVSQASAAFRLPFPLASEFPGLNTVQYTSKAAPSDLPTEGLLLGEHTFLRDRREVRFETQDRLRHTYVVGQTGTGKSTLFLNMILQDIEAGRGVGLIDPHGELIEAVLPAVAHFHKQDKLIHITPKNYEFPVGINLLENRTHFEKDFCVNYLLEVFDTLYNLTETGGPIFEMYMRNALYLLIEQDREEAFTVLDVPRLFQESGFRKNLLKECTNDYVVNFWRKEAEAAGGDISLRNVAPYITSKLARFVYNDMIRGMVGQRRSTIDFREVMDQGKILLVDLRKGILGETNSHFLGMLIVGKLLAAALSRTGARTEERPDLKNFFLYVDEFQNLATRSFVTILSEARKYGLALTVTNQYVSQLPDPIIQSILGNVGTLASFRVGSDDAELLGKEFGQVVSPADLMGLPNWRAYIRLLIRGNVSAPFDLRTIAPRTFDVPLREIQKMLVYTRVKYGKRREDVEIDLLKSNLNRTN